MQPEIKYPTLSADQFELKPAFQWIRDAKRKEMPEKLLNDLWSEGEIVAMFGDTGTAKSVFAVQIAETLANGGSFSSSRSRRGPRKVLYIDTDANEKQFESRYAADHAGGRARFLHRHYKFAAGLTRAEYDAGMLMPKKGESVADLFISDLRRMVAAAGADTIIIDSLTSLVSSHYGNRQLIELLVGLRRLRKELGLSILVVLQTMTTNRTSELRMGTALFRAVASRTDGIFGLARDRTAENRVYLKQVSSRNAPILYDSAHVPVFEVRKLDDNYLSFELAEYAPEAELLDDIRSEQEWETIELIKKMSDSGWSLRRIAAEIDIPKTRVHHLLRMWREPVGATTESAARPEPAAREEASAVDDRAVSKPFIARHFPGCEEFHAAENDPRFTGVYDDRRPERSSLRREFYLIALGHAEALAEYDKTGVAPSLAEMFERYRRKSENALGDIDEEPVRGEGPEEIGHASKEVVPGVTAKLTPSFDGYGKPIYIESFAETGKPKVWYKRSNSGRFSRYIRSHVGISIEGI